jgi:hypothetical protein
MHQLIANQLRSLRLMSIKLNSLADIQHELLAPVHWAMNSTYHTMFQATSAQLAFHVTWLCQQVIWCIGNPSANDIKPSPIMTTSAKTCTKSLTHIHWAT